MNFMMKLERKFRGRGIPNLTIYIIVCYVIGFAIQMVSPEVWSYISLEPSLILRGQIWRLVTWILTPPSSLDIFTIIMLLFYYQLGTALEKTMGDFRYTVYIISGLIFTVIGAFLLYFIAGGSVGSYFSTYYISMSIFLAFAALYPNMQVMLYFIFPIKIKWLAWLDVAFLAYDIFQVMRVSNAYFGTPFTVLTLSVAIPIVASLLNFILFFLMTRNLHRYSPKEVKRRQQFQKAVNRAQAQRITKHKCAVCGQTEDDNPDLEFRFCSKCNGNYEYCQNHLFTHTHIQ